MSSDSTFPSVPSHWEVAGSIDPVPFDLLGPPRYRCSEDGTRVYSLADVAAHDEHFHAKTEGRAEPQSADDAQLRSVAFSHAVNATGHAAAASEIVKQAETILAFLRGEQAGQEKP